MRLFGIVVLTALVVSIGFPAILTGAVIYVRQEAQSGGDGRSWQTAYNDIQSALDLAVEGEEIWVATGIYYPTDRVNSSDPRTEIGRASGRGRV